MLHLACLYSNTNTLELILNLGHLLSYEVCSCTYLLLYFHWSHLGASTLSFLQLWLKFKHLRESGPCLNCVIRHHLTPQIQCSHLQWFLGDQISYPGDPLYTNQQCGPSEVGYWSLQEVG